MLTENAHAPSLAQICVTRLNGSAFVPAYRYETDVDVFSALKCALSSASDENGSIV